MYYFQKILTSYKLAKHKTFYTRDLMVLLHFEKNRRLPSRRFFKTSTFCYIFTIFYIKWGVLGNHYFYTGDIFLNFTKNIGAFHHKGFSKHPLFTIFPPFLIVIEVWIIGNKYWFSNRSPKNKILHKTDEVSPSFPKRVFALHRRHFLGRSTFITFSLVLKMGELCNNLNSNVRPLV